MNGVLYIVIILSLGACTGSYLNESQSQIKSLGNGDYIYYFKYTDGCLTDDQIKVCAEKQLINKKLLPAVCINGIEVFTGKGPDGGGWLYAKFRCN
jgi:hypothetical protein